MDIMKEAHSLARLALCVARECGCREYTYKQALSSALKSCHGKAYVNKMLDLGLNPYKRLK